jgi:TolB-like protein
MSEEAAPQQSTPTQPLPVDRSGEDLADSVWNRIKRHKVVEWSLAYIAFGYAALHASQLLRETLELPVSVPRVTLLVLTLGLPIAVTLAWFHGHRARQRVSRAELSILIALLLAGGTILWLTARSPHHGSSEALHASTAGPQANAVPAFAPPPHSIAVLPFLNMSGDPKQDYFSDGITEELLNSLARLSELQVAARTSSFSFRGQNVSTSSIARSLNVGTILEGSVRRAGQRVRITAQLINGVTGFHMWSQTYDRDLTDILKVQADVATAVAGELELRLAGGAQSRIELGRTEDPEAFDAYLRGQKLFTESDWNVSNDDALRAAVTQFDRAIARDPAYAMAYVGKSLALGALTFHVNNENELHSVAAQARESAERAVALAPGLGAAHLALGHVLGLVLMDFTAAAPEYERALALAPGDARVQQGYASFAVIVGHAEPALRAARRAVALDPQNIGTLNSLGFTLLGLRQFDEALVALHHAEVLDPKSEWTRIQIARVLLAQGKVEQACQLGESLSPQAGHQVLAIGYYKLGRPVDATRELEMYKAVSGGDQGVGVEYAMVLAQWGRKDEALKALAKSVRDRSTDLQLWRTSWELDPLHTEPAFQALERQLNFPP